MKKRIVFVALVLILIALLLGGSCRSYGGDRDVYLSEEGYCSLYYEVTSSYIYACMDAFVKGDFPDDGLCAALYSMYRNIADHIGCDGDKILRSNREDI